MTARAAPRGRRAPSRAAVSRRRRRRTLSWLAMLALGAVAVVVLLPTFHKAVRAVTLPLKHADIIRQQAGKKKLDPALIAAVIYAESHFRDQTSATGAKGLMQIQPSTAQFIARRSGGTKFEVADLGTPQVNISYGSYYLRYLLDRYAGNEVLAIAAYNGGETNVDRWIVERRSKGKPFTIDAIPFPETRHYVEKVLNARNDYRREYRNELGL
jgi:soluble lytic murein transglycosylase